MSSFGPCFLSTNGRLAKASLWFEALQAKQKNILVPKTLGFRRTKQTMRYQVFPLKTMRRAIVLSAQQVSGTDTLHAFDVKK